MAPPTPSPPPSDRVERTLRRIDVRRGRGLEIGPLYSPMVHKAESDVRYVDVDTTEALRAHYSTHPGIPAEAIVGVDVPLRSGDRMRSLSEALADDPVRVSWVVASHVVEHVPDLVAWFRDLASVMDDGALLALAVPDRRYSFDARRPRTTIGEVLLAHERADLVPSVRAVFDHHHEAVHVSPPSAWRGHRPGADEQVHDLHYAMEQVRRQQVGGEYVDCHVWVFTPAEFVGQLQVLAELDLLDFVVDDVLSTAVDELEFYVTLRRLPRAMTPHERAEAVATGFRTPVDDELPGARERVRALVLRDDRDQHVAVEDVSLWEWRVIRAKRSVFTAVRRTVARARRAVPGSAQPS